MGGHGSGRKNRTTEIINSMKGQSFEPKTPIATEMFLPNVSNVQDFARKDRPNASGLTAGSVLFANAQGQVAQDNANFFWDATNKRLGLGTTTPETAFNVHDGDITIESTGATDPTIHFETTRTAHDIEIHLDESATNDVLTLEGHTVGVDTEFLIAALSTRAGVFHLKSGTNEAHFKMDNSGDLEILNENTDKDIVWKYTHAAETHTVTISAEDNKLKHSTGTFNFDDDNIVTTGNLTVSGTGHDAFSDFVANEHIDWTSTSSNFSTSGTLGAGALTATNGTFTNTCSITSAGVGLTISKTTGAALELKRTNATAQTWQLSGGTNFQLFDVTDSNTVAFQIDKGTQNVGIGTSPGERLHIKKAGSAAIKTESTGNGNPSGLLISRERLSGTNSNAGAIYIDSDTSTNNPQMIFQLDSVITFGDSGSARMVIGDGAGNDGFVGIGTTSPRATLDVNGILAFKAKTELTIAAGVITVTQNFHTVDTQDDDATDDLVTINGGVAGMILVLVSQASNRDTTLKDGTGNLALAGDFTLTDADDTITLISVEGTVWREISRSNNS